MSSLNTGWSRLGTALKDGLRNISPSCRDATRLQSLALDRPLSPAKRLGLRVHLLLCRWCRRYGRQLHFLHHAAHEHPDELANAAPQTLTPEARERMKQLLRDRDRDLEK